MATSDSQLLWEELDLAHLQPLRTASLIAHESSFHLLRENGGPSLQLWSNLTSAFLPQGYPESVTPDYLSFQLWDTLQGISTYIRSMLSTQALLSGIGVGQNAATVLGATFQWFLRDFTGMLGGIIFTIYQGSNLDSQAKQWRLTADFMNDIGMLMDLVSPLFPKVFVTLVCIGSIARSVTGVASGATRAALTQHFALQQNAADISAKEGSQETAATLTGMLLGMLLAKLTSGNTGAIWLCFLALTGFHMYANYRAVRCLCLTSLNRERAKIVLHAFLSTGKVLSPADVSVREKVLPQISSVMHLVYKSNQRVTFGARISSITLDGGWKLFPQLVQHYSKEYYILIFQEGKIYVVLHRLAAREDFLKSYIHALVAARFLEHSEASEAETQSCAWMENSYPQFLSKLGMAGWNIERVLVHPQTWRAVWSSTRMGVKSD